MTNQNRYKMTFKEILEIKIKHYGKTEAAYEFAAEEYSNELIKEVQAEQRKLLEAFVKQLKEDNELTEEITWQDINKCITSNCG
jgi:hypothetical protein